MIEVEGKNRRRRWVKKSAAVVEGKGGLKVD